MHQSKKGQKNGNAKLSDAEVLAIKRSHAAFMAGLCEKYWAHPPLPGPDHPRRPVGAFE